MYEKTTFANEVGAAVSLASSALIVLRHLGVDFKKAHFCSYNANHVINGQTLEVIQSAKFATDDSSPEAQGAPFQTVYRVHLQEALRELAVDENGEGPPCQLFTKSTVIDYEPENGVVIFAEGRRDHADLIIAADGVRSRSLSRVLQKNIAAKPTNTTVIRFLLQAADVLADPITAPLFGADEGSYTFKIFVYPDQKRWLISYWCDDYRLLNFAMYTVHEQTGQVESQDLRFTTDREGLRRELGGFHKDFTRIADMTTDILPLWKCTRCECVRSFTRGRMVVIGDAAHAMLPVSNLIDLDKHAKLIHDSISGAEQ